MTLGITTLLIFIVLSGCTQQTGITIDGNTNEWKNIPVFIQDKKGDVKNQQIGNNSNIREIHEFDVTSIKCATDSDNLYVLLEFADNLYNNFDHNRDYSRNIGILYFDTDNNTNTGTTAFASNFTGLESKITINSGVWNLNTGVAVSGGMNLSGITKKTELKYFVEYASYLFNDTTHNFSNNVSQRAESYQTPKSVAYDNNYIELMIPLEKIGLQDVTNSTIKIYFTERGSGLGDSSFSEATDTLYHI
jgi:hypothetical protein